MKDALLLFLIWLMPYSLIIAQENNQCQFTRDIVCGETVLDTIYADDPVLEIFYKYGSFDSKVRWYKFVGTAEVVFVSTTSMYAGVYIYANGCGSQENIVYNQDKVRFESSLGSIYYVAITNNPSDDHPFSLTLECSNPPNNDLCENATGIDFGDSENSDTILTSIKFALDDEQCYSIEQGIHSLDGLNLPNAEHPTGLIQASQSISAQNTIIGPMVDYQWTAGDSITLNPGFEIQPQSTLEINIYDCSNNN